MTVEYCRILVTFFNINLTYKQFFLQIIFIKNFIYLSSFLIMAAINKSELQLHAHYVKWSVNKSPIYRNFNDETAVLTLKQNMFPSSVVPTLFYESIENSCIIPLTSFAFWKLALCSSMKFNSVDITLYRYIICPHKWYMTVIFLLCKSYTAHTFFLHIIFLRKLINFIYLFRRLIVIILKKKRKEKISLKSIQ